MSQNAIVIKGAREHNLKNIDLTIPRDKLVVITGLSGSGKSSLGLRHHVRRGAAPLRREPLQLRPHVPGADVQARPGQHRRPVAGGVHRSEDHVASNPRSTVGTTTEIYDYLRLLFARVGIPHCPECGRVIKSQTTDQVTDDILALRAGRQGHSSWLLW